MGMSEIPDCCRTGNVDRFDPDSSWWIFNFVANYAYGRFSEIYPDIQKVQQELESHFLKLQPVIEKTALSLSETDPELMRAYLNDYSNSGILKVHTRWSKLAADMIVKFNDGYIRSPSGRYPNVGYPDAWLRKVIQEKGDQFRLPPKEKASQ
jgi:dipeptidase